jgi:signal peptidase I
MRMEAYMEENNDQKIITDEMGKPPKPETSLTSEAYEWAESIVFALSIVVIIFTFIIRPVGVEGPSMQNTLHSGDKVVICNINYTPKQGDIIVLSTKGVPKTPIIKRVIAVGGQTVKIDYNASKVYVDGKEYDAPIKETMQQRGDVALPAKVPQGCVFVMGDNRNDSLDSRYSQVGMVNTKCILGRAVFRILPFSSFGFLH